MTRNRSAGAGGIPAGAVSDRAATRQRSCSVPARHRQAPSSLTAADARALTQALCGRWHGGYGLARCPAHADRTPSLSIADGRDGRILIRCFAGCSFDAVRRELAARGLWCGEASELSREALAERERTRALADMERQAKVKAALAGARPIQPGDLADRYLRGRGLLPGPDGWPPTLRLGEHRGSGGGRWPALVAVATCWPARRAVACQVTPLAERRGRVGKAWSKPARLSFGPVAGAAMATASASSTPSVSTIARPSDHASRRTAAPDVTPWAVLGTANAASVLLPAGAEVVLALDGDAAGRAGAARAAAALWARGHRVRRAEMPDGADPAAMIQGDAA